MAYSQFSNRSLYVFLFFLWHSSESQINFGPGLRLLCPSLMNNVFKHYAPRGGMNAGVYKIYKPQSGLPSLQECVEFCCEDTACNVVFMHNSTCFKIECISEESCEPVLRTESNFEYASMVLVRPFESFQGVDVPDLTSESETRVPDESVQISTRSCDITIPDDCGPNEECLATKNSDTSYCACLSGFERSSANICVLSNGNSSDFPKQTKLTSTITSPSLGNSKVIEEGSTEAATPLPNKVIIVSVSSKQVRLPEDEVTLSAFSVPADTPESAYSYKWELISQPVGSNTNTVVENKEGKLKLKHLTEGVYTFKVTVTGKGVSGEAKANVTVLPQKRLNELPKAIVLPSHQTVKLPNSLAVLDATSSKDDDGIVKYHWELQQGPLGYQPNLTDTQTLQLKDLHKPGNYTFRLTVTDTDGATNSTVANITVLQVPDYPPEANAGSSIVIFLPRNNVTLNGSLSSDDKGIASWEWTKSPGDQDKAVDMQNTRTPYLQLSHLEEGMYTFVLKVTDDAGQSSVSDVHVFVKPPTNKPPTANAGTNKTIALPQTWVLLNGSQSSDDIGIAKWQWEQISGPRKTIFKPENSSVTNATQLTKGDYLFKLTVYDEDENSASAFVGVTVTQNKNAPPKANAGGDQTYIMPLGVLIVNGSQSSDDLGIAKWQWTREPSSLALGTIIEQTDTTPVLMVTNVVPGRYEFKLRVTDDQGESDEDTVSIIIKPDPELLNLVALTLNIEASKLTESQRNSVLVKLGMLLRDASQLVVRDLKPDQAGRAVLIFYVSSLSGSVPGPQVVRTLSGKLAQDSFLLQISVVSIRTIICQNNCSGHGVCDQETRECFCEAFWMQDLIQKYIGDGESNCGWSILYVGIALLSLLLLAMSGVWGIICLCSRLCHHSAKDNTRYALLESTEQVRLPMSKVTLSDSETDSDILFENRHGKSNGIKRNGFKPERRVKT